MRDDDFKHLNCYTDPDYHGFWRTACGELLIFGKVAVNKKITLTHKNQNIFRLFSSFSNSLTKFNFYLKLKNAFTLIWSQLNWEQNMAECCKLGMQPISIESDAKAQCLNKFIDGWLYHEVVWKALTNLHTRRLQLEVQLSLLDVRRKDGYHPWWFSVVLGQDKSCRQPLERREPNGRGKQHGELRPDEDWQAQQHRCAGREKLRTSQRLGLPGKQKTLLFKSIKYYVNPLIA